jgi:histidinol-phosphate/aromatic aminotransferase/cobyric acid decarboxylase-like protein
MLSETIYNSTENNQLRELISRRYSVNLKSIWTFEEFDTFLTRIFKQFERIGSRLVTVTPAPASIALAADRVQIKVETVESRQPFVGEIESIDGKISSDQDIIYMANPNRFSGCTYSISQISKLAVQVQNGLLIVDEYYHDFSNLTAVSLLQSVQNLVIIRPIESWVNVGQSAFGYALFGEEAARRFSAGRTESVLSRQSAGRCCEIFRGEKAITTQVELIQRRGLGLAKELSALGIKCHISPANFVLLCLKNPLEIKKQLAENDVTTELVGESPSLSNYLRYEITGGARDRKLVSILAEVLRARMNDTSRISTQISRSSEKIQAIGGSHHYQSHRGRQ